MPVVAVAGGSTPIGVVADDDPAELVELLLSDFGRRLKTLDNIVGVMRRKRSDEHLNRYTSSSRFE